MSRRSFFAAVVLAQVAVVGPQAAAAPLQLSATIPSTLPRATYTGWWTGDGLVGSAAGIAYGRVVDGFPRYATTARPTGALAPVAVGLSKAVSLVGDQLVGWTPGDAWQPGDPWQLVSVDLATGGRQALGPTSRLIDPDSELTEALPRGTGNGWLEARIGAAGLSDALVLHPTSGAGPVTLPFPDPGTRDVLHAAADATGAAVSVAYGSNGVPVDGTTGYAGFASYYVDFATGTWTRLPDDATALALSPHDVAWLSGTSLGRLPRSAPGSTPELRTVPPTTTRIAITDGATAWAGVDGGDVYARGEWAAGGTVSTALEPAGTPGVTLQGHVVNAAELAAVDGNDFAVALDGGTLAGGIYRLSAGSPTAAAELDSFPHTPATSSEGPGQHVTLAGDGSSATLAQVAVTHGALALTSTRHIVAPAGGSINAVAVGSGRTAVMTTTGTRSEVTVSGGGARTVRLSVPASTHDLQLSGRWLELTDWQRKNGSWRAHARLLDLSRPGVHWIAVPGPSALSGHRLAYLKPDGSVWLRDLATPARADKRITGPGTPPDVNGGEMQVTYSGDWVSWWEYDYSHPAPFQGAYQVSTGRHVAVDRIAAQSDGLAAYTDNTDKHLVHLLDLATGRDVEVPGSAYAGGLSLSRDVLSYVDLGGDTVLVSVSGLSHVHPRALPISGDPAARTVKVSAKVPLVATFGTTRPLTSWTFEVRSSKGVLVFRSHGTAPTGWLRVAWSARDGKGRRVPAGTYRWTLSGKGSDGMLLAPDGTAAPTGLLHV